MTFNKNDFFLPFLFFLIYLESLSIFSRFGLYVAPPSAIILTLIGLVSFQKLKISNLLIYSTVFFVYFTIRSSIEILMVLSDYSQGYQYIKEIFKSWLSLALGFGSYLGLRLIFLRYPIDKCFKYLLLASCPTVTVSILQAINVFDFGYLLFEFIDNFRVFILGNYISTGTYGRVSGLANEPAHFGAYISILILPVLFIVSKFRTLKAKFCALLLLLLLAITFSATSYVIFGVMLLAFSFIFISNKKFLIASFFLAPVLLASVVLVMRGDNYLALQLRFAIDGGHNWIPKYGSTLGPLMAGIKNINLFGYGMGSFNFELQSALPDFMIPIFVDLAGSGQTSLKSVVGRIINDGGLIGFVLFLLIFSKVGLYFKFHPVLAHVAFPLVVGILVTLASGNVGSYAHPLLWFWIAVADAIFMKNRHQKFSEKL